MSTEARLQQRIAKELTTAGWLVRKVSYEGRRGCPDLICMRDGRVVFIEVKSPTGRGRLSRFQELEHARLREAGMDVMVVSDIDEIRERFNT